MARVWMTFLSLLVLFYFIGIANGQPYGATTWTDAHATYFSGPITPGVMGGECGYGNLYETGYGSATAALSNELFNSGQTCGACFQIVCNKDQTTICYPDRKSVVVTGTGRCAGGPDGFCDSPKLHFDLEYSMFASLAPTTHEVLPIQFKRIPCVKQGGIRFNIRGSLWHYYVLVLNVGGPGNVQALAIKGDNTDFMSMDRVFGQVWSHHVNLLGQSLSFKVTVGENSFQRSSIFWSVADPRWTFGQTFESTDNFHSL